MDDYYKVVVMQGLSDEGDYLSNRKQLQDELNIQSEQGYSLQQVVELKGKTMLVLTKDHPEFNLQSEIDGLH